MAEPGWDAEALKHPADPVPADPLEGFALIREHGRWAGVCAGRANAFHQGTNQGSQPPKDLLPETRRQVNGDWGSGTRPQVPQHSRDVRATSATADRRLR
eukprot:12155610-Alexandrium_andersonii.AAC.1